MEQATKGNRMRSPAKIARQSRAYVATLQKHLHAFRLARRAVAAHRTIARRLSRASGTHVSRTEAVERALIHALSAEPETLLAVALVRGRR